MEIAKYVLLIVYVLIAPVTVWLSLLILINFATIWDMLSTRHRQCRPWVINVAARSQRFQLQLHSQARHRARRAPFYLEEDITVVKSWVARWGAEI